MLHFKHEIKDTTVDHDRFSWEQSDLSEGQANINC